MHDLATIIQRNNEAVKAHRAYHQSDSSMRKVPYSDLYAAQKKERDARGVVLNNEKLFFDALFHYSKIQNIVHRAIVAHGADRAAWDEATLEQLKTHRDAFHKVLGNENA